jgi:hypothetical protein
MRILLLSLSLVLFTGCAIVRVETPKWSMTGYSLFKTIEVPRLVVNGTNGEVVIEGYRGAVDAEALNEMVTTVVSAAVKFAQPK